MHTKDAHDGKCAGQFEVCWVSVHNVTIQSCYYPWHVPMLRLRGRVSVHNVNNTHVTAKATRQPVKLQ